MGTFMGHLIPGLALVLLGLWHTINTVQAYFLKGPNKFTIRFWHPLKTPLQHLEPILIFSFSTLAILAQIFDINHLRFSFELDNIEHSTIFLSLIIFTSFTLLTEAFHLSDHTLEVSGILVSSVLGQELFLLHYHSTDHVGLEGHYHFLMQLIVLASFLSALYATFYPNSFQAMLILSVSVLFQGCWFVNMGFNLWVPYFVPQGCVVKSSGGAVVCGSEEADLRGRALCNLEFCWMLSSILVFVGSVCVVFGRRFVLCGQYQQLSGRGVDGTVGLKQIQLQFC